MSEPIVDKILNTIDQVKEYLSSYPEYRDNDEKLCGRFWFDQIRRMGYNTKKANINDFLVFYGNGLLASADVITRARRKVQKRYPELRGKTWNERHGQAEDVRQYINSDIKPIQNGNSEI
jgi:hypothetical protein